MMALVNRIGLTALVIGMVAASSGRAPAGFIYNVNLSVPDSNGPGTDSVTGTITADKLGALAATDFVALSLTFADPNGATTMLSQSSGDVVFYGATVNASATSLTVTMPAPSSDGSAYFLIGASGSAPQLYYNQAPTGNQFAINPPAAYGYVTLSPTGGTYTLGIAAAVPEPSTFVLMGIAGITGLGYPWRRRRAKVVA
jgi:hypothetical protein